MLVLEITPKEYWDEANERFVHTEPVTLKLEHSLLSISKWESITKKPFFGTESKTPEQIIKYIQCMDLDEHDSNVFKNLNQLEIDKVSSYLSDPYSATWFSNNEKKTGRKETITSEVIYYMMFSYGIPIDCEKWHINRLLTLIRVFNEKNKPAKKTKTMDNDALAKRRALNEARKNKMNTKG